MALSEAFGGLPPAVRAGLERMAADGLYFAPVRHHSPACALALQALIREVRPAAVLIEGPDDFEQLLLLLDPATRPPVAVLCQVTPPRSAAEDAAPAPARSSFFPFCDYSPEWVALREAAAIGARAAFIDQPWRLAAEHEDAGEEARSLMSERYLAHSAYLKALAARSGCRDQDELWDHLFELREASALRDWRSLFADVFCYCAMARNDYESAVLEADGSLPRERHMAAHIRRWRAQGAGPLVVVTGGFHTIALQQMLDAPAAPAKAPVKTAAGAESGNWLIRYSFDRLDALNGYAAGMPSPAFHQWVWDSANAGPEGPDLRQIAVRSLAGLAQRSRELGLAEQVSTAEVQAATLQAFRLAELRGHAGPGRQDLLDAVRSCFVKGAIDDGTRGLAADIHAFLGGNRLGDVPPSAGSPPVLEDARRIAKSMGIRLDDSTPRRVQLDIYRKERHRARSRFLHLMAYLGSGLGRWQGGPDFIGASSLELIVEEWQVGWNPMVEARMIELAPLGATLADAAMARLRKEEDALGAQGSARSAAHAVGLLVRACVIGLHQRLPALLAMLEAHLDEDANALSVIACGHRLLVLFRAREPLGVQDNPLILTLLLKTWNGALYLLPQLAEVKPEGEAQAIDALLSLRALHEALRDCLGEDGLGETAHWPAQLERMAAAGGAAPGVASAAATLLFLDGHWSEAQLSAMLAVRFGPGAAAHDAVRALHGLMSAAPELLLAQAGLRRDVERILAGWDEQTFIAYLPDLRQAFARLKPQETASLAEALAAAAGGAQEPLAQLHYAASESDMLAGIALQADLLACLERDGLGGWSAARGQA